MCTVFWLIILVGLSNFEHVQSQPNKQNFRRQMILTSSLGHHRNQTANAHMQTGVLISGIYSVQGFELHFENMLIV